MLVQAIRTRTTDPASILPGGWPKARSIFAVRSMFKDFNRLASHRPDLRAGTSAFSRPSTVIEVNCLTSEAKARESEKELALQMKDPMRRFGELARPLESFDPKSPVMS